MSVTDELLQANSEYARTFDRGDLPMPPARRLAIVTCMDARIMLTFTNRDLHAKVKQDLGVDSSNIDFLPFADVEVSVREDVALLLSSPLIPANIGIRGFVYEVRTGKLNEVGFEPALERK